MKRTLPLLLAVLAPFPSRSEEPLPVEILSADSLAEREEAQKTITRWASSNPDTAKERILRIYLRSKDPEIRRRLLPALEHAYFPSKGYVGVQMMSARFDRLGNLRRPGKGEDTEGVVITWVAPETPAEKSGLKAGDVILGINDWEVGGEDRVSATAKEIQKNRPGTAVSLSVRREEKILKLTLKLGVLPTPSERASMQRDSKAGRGLVSDEVRAQLAEFRNWILSEIEKDRKNLIADRRL